MNSALFGGDAFRVPPHDHPSLPRRWHDGPEVALLGAAILACALDVLVFRGPVASLFVAVAGLSLGAVRVIAPSLRAASRMTIGVRVAAVLVAFASPFGAYAGSRAKEAHTNEAPTKEAVGEVTNAIVMFQIREGRWPSSLDELKDRDLPAIPRSQIALAPPFVYAPPVDPEAANRAVRVHDVASYYTTGPTLTFRQSDGNARRLRFVPGGYFVEV